MHYVLRQGEIPLKGRNRPFFEDKLAFNVKKICNCSLEKAYGRLYVKTPETVDFRRVFGVVSYSPALRTGKDYEEISKEVLELARSSSAKNFKVEAHRLDKSYPLKSPELNKRLGALVKECTGKEVDLENPELVLGVEVSRKHAYIYTKTVPCFGGLPVGVEGVVAAWLEDWKSLLAALLVMKRGCDVVPVASKEVNTCILEFFGCSHGLVKKKSLKECEGLGVLAVIVNDTLQTLREHCLNVLTLRPLISYTEEQAREVFNRYEGVFREAGKES